MNSIQVIESNAKKGGDEVPDIAAIPSFIDPTDDSQQRPVALQLLPVHNTQWWDRSTLNPVKVEVSRLISADKVDCLFTNSLTYSLTHSLTHSLGGLPLHEGADSAAPQTNLEFLCCNWRRSLSKSR